MWEDIERLVEELEALIRTAIESEPIHWELGAPWYSNGFDNAGPFTCAQCGCLYCPVPYMIPHIRKSPTFWGTKVYYQPRHGHESWLDFPMCSEECAELFQMKLDKFTKDEEEQWNKIKEGRSLLKVARKFLNNRRDV